MKILKNSQKTKADGFNVWDVITNVSEIALFVFTIVAMATLIYVLNKKS